MPVPTESIDKKIVKSPSFLQELLNTQQLIYLLYNKHGVEKHPEESLLDDVDEVKTNNENENENETSQLDLTGCPLETDLKGDLSISYTAQEEKLDNWSNLETKFFPLPVDQARGLLNEHSKNKHYNVGDCQGIPIYCICDGSDDSKTLILGNHTTNAEFIQFMVQAKGLYPLNHPEMSIEEMVENHENELPIISTIKETEVNCMYTLYGHYLRDASLWDKLEKPGCVQTEITWNKLCYEIPEYISDLKAVLQVIIGHPNSAVYSLWEQIQILKAHIYLLETDNCDGDIDLNTDNDLDNILEQIEEILFASRSMKKNLLSKKNATEINVDQLRVENLLDQLYKVLNCCNSIENLKQCFHKIFDEIAQNPDLKLYIPEDNKTAIAKTLNNLHKGTCAVPTLTSKQALEYLIELGLEKLRQDYFYILQYFKCIDKDNLMQYWQDTLTSEDKPQTNLKSRMSRRTSRMIRTQQFITANEVNKKLTVIARMHVIVEFMFLMKDCPKFPQDTITHITESIVKQHLHDSPLNDFYSIESNRIYQVEAKLSINDPVVKNLEKNLPSSWRINIKTPHKLFTTVQTTYFISHYPIFPPNIISTYETMEECGNDVYYNTKLTVYSDNLQ